MYLWPGRARCPATMEGKPIADFLSVADSSNLFEFVAGIKDGGEIWVFPFDTAQEMFEVLRAQLAYLFLDALKLRAKVRGSGSCHPPFRAFMEHWSPDH